MKPAIFTIALLMSISYSQAQESSFFDLSHPVQSSEKTEDKMNYTVDLNNKVHQIQISSLNQDPSPVSFSIFDSEGTLKKSGMFSKELILNISDLSSGSYVVELTNPQTKANEVHEFVVK